MYRLFAFFFLVFLLENFSFAQNASHPLIDSANAQIKQDNYRKADAFCARLKEQLQKEGKTESLLYGDAESLHAIVFQRLNRIPDAEISAGNGLRLHKKINGENSLSVGEDLNLLGGLEGMKGKDAKADSIFQLVLPIFTATYPEKHIEIGKLFINMGSVSMEKNVSRAERNLLKGLEIVESQNPKSQNAANGHNNLAKLYGDLGEFKKQIFHVRKAIDILEANGSRHPYMGIFYNNLSAAYAADKQYDLAERIGQIGYQKLISTFGENHPVVGSTLNRFAILAFFNNNFFKALQTFRKAELILKANAGDPSFLVSLYQAMMNTYSVMGNVKAEDSCYLKGKTELKKLEGNDPLGFNSHKFSITRANRLRTRDRHDEAEELFLQANNKIQAQITNYFPGLSDNGKAQFLQMLKEEMDDIRSFFISRIAAKPSIAGVLFDHQLTTKAILLSSAAKWKQRIKTSGDLKLIQIYGRWAENQNKLSKLYREPEENHARKLDSCLAINESLEKELSRRSENFARLSEKNPVSWKQVQAKLKPGEAAIELIRINAFGVQKTVKDTSDPQKSIHKLYGLLDSALYAALLVKPGMAFPELILLPRGNEMEGKFLTFYRNCIEKQLPDNQSYQIFWAPIGKKLLGIKRLYFSPEGVYHSINLNTLQNPKTGKFLLEEIEISQITSTKDLLAPKQEEDQNQLAYLFGYPNYNTNLAMRTNEVAKMRNSPELVYSLSGVRGEGFAELPGTKVEVESISAILKGKGWEVNTLEGNLALEETLKESLKPRVLHLATHGFFDPDTSKGSNPLLHSGLLLTGANRSFAGEKADQAEDGILTAYEAMNLNLDNTDLVVLSACETGLGEIKNGEGVYGLQRAFKVAGAKSLIMSLWKVDDDATQELMVAFYRNWLGGTSKRAAFLKAQKELKIKYSNPYYWGAFVMVGE